MPDRRRHGAHEDRGAGGAAAKRGLSLHDRLVGYLPRYAPWAARLPGAARTCATGCRRWRGWSEKHAGFSARRKLPAWREDLVQGATPAFERDDGPEVVLFADTFNRYFEPENVRGGARRCSKPPAAGCICRSRWTARRGRSAAGARSCRSVWSTRRARRRERTLAALAPFVEPRRAGGRARAELHPRFPRRDPGLAEDRGGALAGGARHAVRGVRGARARRRLRCRWSRSASGRCCTAIATRNPSARWVRSRRR